MRLEAANITSSVAFSCLFKNFYHGERMGRSAASRIESELPDTRPWFERCFCNWPRQLALCLVFGFASRVATFGDPAIHIDEAWYFLVGQWMHQGALPYVDVWDRKPFLLFGLYYLFAGISHSVLAYQIPAWLAASFTAFIIVRMAVHWTGLQGAVLAGLSYLALLNLFDGIGGQAPVFYNLLIAGAALLVIQSFDKLRAGQIPVRVFVAMALCGVAIMVKQTTLFEALFLGIWTLKMLPRESRPWRRITMMVFLGAAPTLAIASLYYLNGHWSEFWHAMVTSNLSKQNAAGVQYLQRTVVLTLRLFLIVPLVYFGIRKSGNHFLLAWSLVAVLGFFAVPNLYYHYCLPVMVPFALAAAPVFNRRALGVILSGLVIFHGLLWAQAFDFWRHRENVANMHELGSAIAAHAPRQTLLTYDAPPLLFALSGTRSLSPLTFPNHLNHEIERNVSHLDTRTEMLRILRERPGAVAISSKPRVQLYNRENLELVQTYIRNHCQLAGEARTLEIGRNDTILIFGNCN